MAKKKPQPHHRELSACGRRSTHVVARGATAGTWHTYKPKAGLKLKAVRDVARPLGYTLLCTTEEPEYEGSKTTIVRRVTLFDAKTNRAISIEVVGGFVRSFYQRLLLSGDE